MRAIAVAALLTFAASPVAANEDGAEQQVVEGADASDAGISDAGDSEDEAASEADGEGDASPPATGNALLGEKGPHEDDPDNHRFVPVLVPTATFNSDEGFGGGVTLTLFHYHGARKPFRDDLSAVIYITSKLIQRYELRWEGLDVLNTPLRVYFRGGYFSTVSQNYCGFGMGVRCDDSVAALAAERAGLAAGSEAHEDFLRHFYQLRYIRPYVDSTVRWMVWREGVKVELLGGLRGSYYIPGQIGELGPYRGSLYAQGFPEGEGGLSSVLLGGIVVDGRDNEPSPTHGYFVEASVRGSAPFWGSKWTYGGFNTSWAGYVTVSRSPELVLGLRGLVDLIYGDAPTEDIAVTGGMRVQPAFGGMWMGRGIREHRYIGKLKLIEQIELRTGFWRWRVPFLNFELGFGGATFLDVGWIGADWDNLAGGIPGVVNDTLDRGNPASVVFGVGGGLRVLVNDSFVLRVDLGYSPYEQRGVGLYMPVGNAF